METCIFCKIINGDIPCYKIYEDDDVLGFLDVNPKSNGHILIIPKKHFKDLLEIDDTILNKILHIAKKLGEAFKEKLNYDGFTLIQNNGDIQEVKHFHLHIIPHYNIENKLLNVEEIHKILNN